MSSSRVAADAAARLAFLHKERLRRELAAFAATDAGQLLRAAVGFVRSDMSEQATQELAAVAIGIAERRLKSEE
jgi:hypothetical protein